MIEITADEFRDGLVTFHISRQDAEDYKYFASDKVYEFDGEIIEVGCAFLPDYYNYIRTENGKSVSKFFLRGTNRKSDEINMKATINDYLLLNKFVNFYNKDYDVMKKISKGESIYEWYYEWMGKISWEWRH